MRSSLRTRLPAWLLKPIVLPIGLRIFNQDREVLKLQSETIAHFGEEAFASTEIDLLGHHIQRLLRLAAADKLPAPGSEPTRREVTLRV